MINCGAVCVEYLLVWIAGACGRHEAVLSHPPARENLRPKSLGGVFDQDAWDRRAGRTEHPEAANVADFECGRICKVG